MRDASEHALGSYCHRMAGKYSPDRLTAWEPTRAIEARKKWRTRIEKKANDH